MVRRRFGQGFCYAWGAISRTIFRSLVSWEIPHKISSKPVMSARRASNASCARSRDPVLDTKSLTVGITLPRGGDALHCVSAPLMLLQSLVPVLMRSLRRLCGYLSGWMHDRFCRPPSGSRNGTAGAAPTLWFTSRFSCVVIRCRCGATPRSGVRRRPSRRGRGVFPAAGSGVRWGRRR